MKSQKGEKGGGIYSHKTHAYKTHVVSRLKVNVVFNIQGHESTVLIFKVIKRLFFKSFTTCLEKIAE